MLLRVPGIGVTSARRIVSARRFAVLTPEGLKKIGVVMKRARFFIALSGRSVEKLHDRPSLIFRKLLAAENQPQKTTIKQRQLTLPGLE